MYCTCSREDVEANRRVHDSFGLCSSFQAIRSLNLPQVQKENEQKLQHESVKRCDSQKSLLLKSRDRYKSFGYELVS